MTQPLVTKGFGGSPEAFSIVSAVYKVGVDGEMKGFADDAPSSNTVERPRELEATFLGKQENSLGIRYGRPSLADSSVLHSLFPRVTRFAESLRIERMVQWFRDLR
jgi:hypothetical protein